MVLRPAYLFRVSLTYSPLLISYAHGYACCSKITIVHICVEHAVTAARGEMGSSKVAGLTLGSQLNASECTCGLAVCCFFHNVKFHRLSTESRSSPTAYM